MRRPSGICGSSRMMEKSTRTSLVSALGFVPSSYVADLLCSQPSTGLAPSPSSRSTSLPSFRRRGLNVRRPSLPRIASSLTVHPLTVKDNQSKQATIQRRPSRVLAAPKRSFAIPAGNTLAPPVAANAQPALAVTSPGASSTPTGGSFRPGTTMGVSSALAIPVLLRVRLPPAPGVDEINTTVSVPNDMYMSDVLGESFALSVERTI
jgi:hypothetical protein